MFYNVLAMDNAQPDDSMIRRYAADNGMHFRWRTIPLPARWRAEVELGRMGSPAPCWVAQGESEQSALDLGMDYAISHFVETATTGKGISHHPPPTGGLPRESG